MRILFAEQWTSLDTFQYIAICSMRNLHVFNKVISTQDTFQLNHTLRVISGLTLMIRLISG